MAFGYTVTRRQREREIRDADRRIAWFDLLRANEATLAPAFGGAPDILEMMLFSEATAAVFGLSRQDAEDLADRHEDWPDWLKEGESLRGYYQRADAIERRLAERFTWEPRGPRDSWSMGLPDTMDPPSEWKSSRAARAKSSANDLEPFWRPLRRGLLAPNFDASRPASR